jgi:hypothetical protein
VLYRPVNAYKEPSQTQRALSPSPLLADKAMKTEPFENFPWWMVAVCNAVGLAIYAIGLYLTARLGIVWAVLYAAYCAWIEWRVLSGSCRSCYYYGKWCGFGKGRLCSLFFTKDAERSLSTRQISWRDVVPDFLVSLIPLGVGIILLVQSFSWLVLSLVVSLVILGSMGTAYVRGQLACKYCKQRELGCPAEQLFNKTKHA